MNTIPRYMNNNPTYTFLKNSNQYLRCHLSTNIGTAVNTYLNCIEYIENAQEDINNQKDLNRSYIYIKSEEYYKALKQVKNKLKI